MNWVSPNVLGLSNQQAGQRGRQILQFNIDNYRITKDADSTVKRNSIYRSSIVPARGQLNVRLLQIPNGDQWKSLSLTPEQQAKLTNAVPFLIRFFIDDARRVPEQVAAAIQSPGEEIPDTTFAKLPDYGIYKKGLKNGSWDFESINGQVQVITTDGVQTTISIGQVGSDNSAGSGKLNYYVMVNSAVDTSLLQEPKRPADLKNDESDENKAFLRNVEQWKKAVELARQRANEMNSINADWLYLVSEDIIKNLRPEIPLPAISSPAKSEAVASEKPAQSADATDQTDDASENSAEDQPAANPEQPKSESENSVSDQNLGFN